MDHKPVIHPSLADLRRTDPAGNLHDESKGERVQGFAPSPF